MREINVSEVTAVVSKLCKDSCYYLPEELLAKLKASIDTEESPLGKEILTTIVPGDKVKITVSPKGCGSENMGALKMLKPADGVEGVIKFVVDTVRSAGPNPCPPVTVGVGIGGNMEKAALLAKYSLSRKVGEHNPNPQYAELEKKLLELVNKTGVGPSGLGGSTTAVAVNVEYAPTHIGGMPVAVNLNCHAARRAEAEI